MVARWMSPVLQLMFLSIAIRWQNVFAGRTLCSASPSPTHASSGCPPAIVACCRTSRRSWHVSEPASRRTPPSSNTSSPTHSTCLKTRSTRPLRYAPPFPPLGGVSVCNLSYYGCPFPSVCDALPRASPACPVFE